MLGLRRTDEIVPHVALIARTSNKRRNQFATRKLVLGESCGLQGYAEAINGRGNRHETTTQSPSQIILDGDGLRLQSLL